MDPFYHFLKMILRSFYRAPLAEAEKLFLEENTRKHRKVLWLNFCAAPLILYGLVTATQHITIVVTALIAPVMVLGTAWFSISFGGMPQKLATVAMNVTFLIFSAFTISFTAMLLAIAFTVTPSFWPILAFIYIATIIACIQYDTADGFKAGKDETALKHSRAALRYYQLHGIKDE